MKTTESHSNRITGIQKVSAAASGEGDDRDALADILNNVLQTREMRQLLITAVPEFLNVWAGQSWWKKMVSRLGGYAVNNQLSRSEDIFRNNEIALLFENEEFIQKVSQQLPEIINGLLDALCSGGQTIENLSVNEKKELFSGLLSGTVTGQTSELMTNLFRIFNDIYKEDPEFLARCLDPGIDKWIEQTDFGELTELVEHFTGDLKTILKNANDSMFERPAKVVLLLSIIPPFTNLLISVLSDTVGRFNNFPPDMVADAILSLLQKVDIKTTGKLLNQLLELARQLNVGSALTGDPGKPKFRQDIQIAIKEVFEQIDGEILWKFREAFVQGKETLNYAMVNALNDKPEVAIMKLSKAPALRNYHYRMLIQNLALFEKLPNQKVVDALSAGISEIDANAMAEVLNLTAIIVNRVKELNPNLLSAVLEEFVNSLDTYEVDDAIKWAIDEAATTLEPIGRKIMPHLIKTVGKWVTPENEEDQGDLDTAKDAIIKFLNHKEVAA